MTRRLPLLLIPLLFAYLLAPRLSAPREGHHSPVPAGASSQGAPVASGGLLGAPLVLATRPTPEASLAEVGTAERTAAPTAAIGQPASYCKPAYCATPEPQRVTSPKGGIGGEATWWFSFGHGLYAAIRPDLGTKGDTAIVCGGEPFHCLTLPVITTCACLGPGSKRLIDLSRDAFSSFADPSVGTIHVVVQIVKGD